MPTATRPLFEQIDSWLEEINTVKTASSKTQPKEDKKASTKKAAPAGVGETSHPSEDVDDETEPAKEGERSAENTADVKADVPGGAVDETDEGSGGTQDDKQYNIGTTQSATGEDPSVEDDYKGDKDDPGTSHPADAEEIGEKYSSVNIKTLLKLAEERAHSILADLANGVGEPKTATADKSASDKPAPKTASKQPEKAESIQKKVAALKKAEGEEEKKEEEKEEKKEEHAEEDKMAADMSKLAAEITEQIIRDAELDADLVGSALKAYFTKKAEGEDEAPHEEPDGDEAPNVESAPPPSADAGAPPGGGADALGALGAGGPPPEAAGGAPGGVSQEQALQELVMALQELGISPEELVQIAQSQGGAGPAGGMPPQGGMPPEMAASAGGPPMDMGAKAAECVKLASAAKDFQRSGKFRFSGDAKTAAQLKMREQIKDYVKEIANLK